MMLEEKHHPRDRSTRPMKDQKRHGTAADRRPKERGHRESHAKSRGRDVGRYSSPTPRQTRREYDITRRTSSSPELPLTKSRGDKARRIKSSVSKKKHHMSTTMRLPPIPEADKEPISEMNLDSLLGTEEISKVVFGEFQKLADVSAMDKISAAHEHIVKFTSEHELGPTSLGNKWLDLVDTYVMPSVKEAGLFGDDTTCVTGTTGSGTEEDACMLEKHEKNQNGKS